MSTGMILTLDDGIRLYSMTGGKEAVIGHREAVRSLNELLVLLRFAHSEQSILYTQLQSAYLTHASHHATGGRGQRLQPALI